jgi:hypothetical protein
MEKRTIASDHVQGGVKARKATMEEWDAAHRSCKKEFAKSTIGGQPYKFKICLTHGDIYVIKDGGGAIIEALPDQRLVDSHGAPLTGGAL